MGVIKYALYDSLKSGIRGLKVNPKQVQAEENAVQKMIHEVFSQSTKNNEQTQGMIHELFKQAKENNDQLARQVDHLMQAHLDIAKTLLEAIKQIHGM